MGRVLLIFGTPVIEKKRSVRPVFPDYLSASYDWCYSELLEYSLNTPSFIFEVQSLVLLVFLISSVLDIGRSVSYCHIHVVCRDQAWLHGT